MSSNVVTILCSGVAMGVYIPALAVRHQLANFDIDAEVIVLESLVIEEKRNKINDTKRIFHKDFRVAKKGHAMARDISLSLDQNLLKKLYSKWRREGRHLFIVFSGFWLPLMMEYLDFVYPEKVYADLVMVDSEISPSWKIFKGDYPKNFEVVKLFASDENRIVQKLFMPKEPIPEFRRRENRMVIHGGGWGMGTYQSHIPELNGHNIGLNVMVYFKEDGFQGYPQNRYFMVDPSWQAWGNAPDDEAMFPPFSEIAVGKAEAYRNREEYHELFYVILNSKGIISKPGGSTLVDSLAAATPIVFLDALSEHEEKNARLWINLGLGITYEAWKNNGFSFDILESLHQNLLEARKIETDYVSSYVNRFFVVPSIEE